MSYKSSRVFIDRKSNIVVRPTTMFQEKFFSESPHLYTEIISAEVEKSSGFVVEVNEVADLPVDSPSQVLASTFVVAAHDNQVAHPDESGTKEAAPEEFDGANNVVSDPSKSDEGPRRRGKTT